jgi:heme A synthase
MYRSLALATAVLTAGLIVFGAVVRVTDSGLGCGDDWPLCNGTIFPPLDNLTAWIEWLHRLFAALIGIMGAITLVAGFRQGVNRTNRLSMVAVGVAAILFFVQSALGAFVVIFDLPPTTVALHLGTALLLLGALLFGYVAAWYVPLRRYPADSLTTLTYITTALSLVIILTGALVRGSGATLACVDWPLCNGAIIPTSQGQLQMIHMVHRYAVLGLGITLALLAWQIFQTRSIRALRWLSLVALAMYATQAGVGALFVLTNAAPVWGAAHVGLAAGTWGVLVILSAIEYLSSRYLTVEEDGAPWKPQSEAVPN